MRIKARIDGIASNQHFSPAKAQRKGMNSDALLCVFAPLREMLCLTRPSLFWAGTSRSVQGGNLLADDRIIRSFVYVDLGPMSVVLRHISIGKNCFHGTLRHARIAIDASVGIDVKTIRQLMKSFNRTNSCAVGVLAIHA